ncbi:hypothetical protein CesoFtcFv8_006908 [Champsocephalus esox]|uniref:Uncharacterized protein n=1 Tax=Champsocephalus esox TaxID=159716 RepID=A0AAN8H4A4_9TELE|nr:hypothetical protein CesoFtcFv8_006908 [Champsocephalus esox]
MRTGEGQSNIGGGRESGLPPGSGRAFPVESVLIRFEAFVSSELDVGSMSDAGLFFLLLEDGLASVPPKHGRLAASTPFAVSRRRAAAAAATTARLTAAAPFVVGGVAVVVERRVAAGSNPLPATSTAAHLHVTAGRLAEPGSEGEEIYRYIDLRSAVLI